MGQAKLRGTFEQRKQQAIERREKMVNGNQPPLTAKVNIKDAPEILCGCGNNTFAAALKLHHISRFQSPNGQEGQVAAFIGYVCLACGAVNDIKKPSTEEAFGMEVSGSGTMKEG